MTFRRGVYIARIAVGNKRYLVGNFDTPEEASAAYLKAVDSFEKDGVTPKPPRGTIAERIANRAFCTTKEPRWWRVGYKSNGVQVYKCCFATQEEAFKYAEAHKDEIDNWPKDSS